MEAWSAVSAGQPNPLVNLLAEDPAVIRYVPEERVRESMDATGHVGDAPERARLVARAIQAYLKEDKKSDRY
jgi:hypothetical protein